MTISARQLSLARFASAPDLAGLFGKTPAEFAKAVESNLEELVTGRAPLTENPPYPKELESMWLAEAHEENGELLPVPDLPFARGEV